jgi:polyketide biosynthesis enoyl-CoA hydratase PksI
MQEAASANALSPAFTAAMLDALARAGADPDARVLLLCGLPEHFSSGAPRELLSSLAGGRVRPTELGRARRLLELEVPVIAACAGAAVGGGLVLACAADLVLLASDRRYGFNFMDLGITPGMGATALAEHAFGPARAHELLYGGEFRRGSDLAAAPGISAVHPSADVEARALDLALRIAAKDRANLSLLKRTLTLPRRRRLEEALTLESLMHESSLARFDSREMGGAP